MTKAVSSVPQLHKSIEQALQPQDDHHLTPLHELLHCLILSTVCGIKTTVTAVTDTTGQLRNQRTQISGAGYLCKSSSAQKP